MKMKKRMKVLSLLMVLIVAVTTISSASAQSDLTQYSIDSEFNNQNADLELPNIKSEAILIDQNKYDNPMTKEEFEKANEGYIKFLYEEFGDEAYKIIDEAYLSSYDINAKSDATIIHIGSYDMYLWPYFNTQTSTSSNSGGINAIFFNKDVDEMASILKGNGWGSALGLTEWGLHGSNLNNMVWTNSPGSNPAGNNQLEDGSYYGDRYHLVMTDGHYSSSIGDDWSYGNCHYEYWSWSGLTHYLYSNSLNTGRNHLYGELSGDASASWISLQNSWSGYFDGWGYIFDMY